MSSQIVSAPSEPALIICCSSERTVKDHSRHSSSFGSWVVTQLQQQASDSVTCQTASGWAAGWRKCLFCRWAGGLHQISL